MFLLAIPSLIICLRYFPKDEPAPSAKSGKPGSSIGWAAIRYGFFALLFVLLNGALGSNTSLFVATEGIGTTAAAGFLGSMGMVGGVLGGLVFGKLSERLGRYTFVVSFGGMAAGFLLLSRAGSLAGCAVAVTLIGACQGLHMPQCLVSMASHLKPNQMVLGSSIVCAIAPNVAAILSPLIITGITTAFWGEAIRPRFMFVGCAALAISLCFAASIFLTRGLKKRETPQKQPR